MHTCECVCVCAQPNIHQQVMFYASARAIVSLHSILILLYGFKWNPHNLNRNKHTQKIADKNGQKTDFFFFPNKKRHTKLEESKIGNDQIVREAIVSRCSNDSYLSCVWAWDNC